MCLCSETICLIHTKLEFISCQLRWCYILNTAFFSNHELIEAGPSQSLSTFQDEGITHAHTRPHLNVPRRSTLSPCATLRPRFVLSAFLSLSLSLPLNPLAAPFLHGSPTAGVRGVGVDEGRGRFDPIPVVGVSIPDENDDNVLVAFPEEEIDLVPVE